MTLHTKAAEIAAALDREHVGWLLRRYQLDGMRLRGSWNQYERTALQSMKRLGLFQMEPSMIEDRKKLWVLTDLGRAVAELLGKSDGR